MIRVLALGFAFGFIAIGCARAPGGVAASNIPLAAGGYTVLGPVSASDCKVNLLGILPISGGNNLHEAIEEALGDRPGAGALVNISVDLNSKFFILWSQRCTEVHATAVSVQ